MRFLSSLLCKLAPAIYIISMPATILMVGGVHPKMVQERMGHSTIAMEMDIYSHVVPSMQREVAEKIDDLVKQE